MRNKLLAVWVFLVRALVLLVPAGVWLIAEGGFKDLKDYLTGKDPLDRIFEEKL